MKNSYQDDDYILGQIEEMLNENPARSLASIADELQINRRTLSDLVRYLGYTPKKKFIKRNDKNEK